MPGSKARRRSRRSSSPRASREAPQALLRQLALGGRMVLPLHEGTGQRLMLYERGRQGFVESELDPVRFVPLEMGKA
jgi:protein-L-isoaspartate(D-aspartate) O-methyltransferase